MVSLHLDGAARICIHLIIESRDAVENDRLPSLPAMARTVVLELATQYLMKSNGLLLTKAKHIAETMVRGYSDW